MASPTAYRLSRNVLPTRYELILEPDLQGFTFSGDVRIDIAVAEPTDTITWGASDDDVLKEEKTDLALDTLIAGETVVMNLTFITAGWTVAQITTWVPEIIWEV